MLGGRRRRMKEEGNRKTDTEKTRKKFKKRMKREENRNRIGDGGRTWELEPSKSKEDKA